MSEAGVFKFFPLDLDHEKEEAWLNEMAAKGMNAIPFVHWFWGLKYRFEQSEPGGWTYRIELLPKDAKKPSSLKYLDFMTEAGIQTVFALGERAYFRKPAASGPFELFSDLDSRISYLRRVRGRIAWSIVPVVFWMALMASYYPAEHPVINGIILAPIVLGVAALVMLLAQTLRVSRRIGSLEAQRRLFE